MLVTKGMSVQRLQDVDKFNAQAALVEVLLLLKETISDPKLLGDLAQRKAEALKLTTDEEKKRQEAMELIARTDELKNSFRALDERERKIDQQHKDNLRAIDEEKASAKAAFDARERAIKEGETALAKKKAQDQADFMDKDAKAKKTHDDLERRMRELDDRGNSLNDLYNKIEAVKSALGT
jgi:chromosome segregation ATPase